MPSYKLMPEPKIQFFSNNGIPLAGGKLYSYEPGTTTLKPTYATDIGPANTNPVILDAGGRASVWLDGVYDMKLTDANDVQIWTQSNISVLSGSITVVSSINYESLDDAVSSIGSTVTTLNVVGVLPTIDNVAVPSTLSIIVSNGGSLPVPNGITVNILGPFTAEKTKIFTSTGNIRFSTTTSVTAYPEWWGALGDGNSGKSANAYAIQKAFNASKTVMLSGNYHLGDFSTYINSPIIDLTALGDNITILTTSQTIITMNTTANYNNYVFVLRGNNNFRCGDIQAIDLGGDVLSTTRGGLLFVIKGGVASDNLSFAQIKTTNMYAVMDCTEGSANRIKNIHIEGVTAKGAYYGVVNGGAADNIVIERMYWEGGRRALFTYNGSGFTCNDLHVVNPAPTNGIINITSYGTNGGFATPITSNVRVNVTSFLSDYTPSNVSASLVGIYAIGPTQNAVIKNIEIDFNGCQFGGNFGPLDIEAFSASGGSVVTSTVNHTMTNIRLSGIITSSGPGLSCGIKLYTAGTMILDLAGNWIWQADNHDTSFVISDMRTYTSGSLVLWTPTVVSPATNLTITLPNGPGPYFKNKTADGNYLVFFESYVTFNNTTGGPIASYTLGGLPDTAYTGQYPLVNIKSIDGVATSPVTAYVDSSTGHIKTYAAGLPTGSTSYLITGTFVGP